MTSPNFKMQRNGRKHSVVTLISQSEQVLFTLTKKYGLASVAQLMGDIEAEINLKLRSLCGKNPLTKSTQTYLRRTRNRLVVDYFLQVMRCTDMKQIDDSLQKIKRKVRQAYIPDILATVQPDGSLSTEVQNGYFCLVPGLAHHYTAHEALTDSFESTTLPQEIREILNSLPFAHTMTREIKAILISRFSLEGVILSVNDLKQMRNEILSCVARNDSADMLELASIVSRTRQAQWLLELLHYKIVKCIGENNQSAQNLRQRLQNIQSKQWISALNYNITLAEEDLRVSDIMEVIDIIQMFELDEATYTILKRLPLQEWKYELKWLEIYRDLDTLDVSLTESEVAECVSRIWDLQNRSGRNLTKRLLEIFRKNQHLTSNKLCLILRNFRASRWMFDQKALDLMERIPSHSWAKELDKILNPDRDRTIDELISYMERDSNNSTSVRRKVRDVGRTARRTDLMFAERSNICKGIYKALRSYDLSDIRQWTDEFQKYPKDNIEELIMENIEEVVVIIKRAIYLVKHCQLRNTQIIALILYILQQISTGEGKSLIIVALAIIRYLAGQTVDVLTSSCVLAIRDAEEYRDVYQVFGATVAHNCSESTQERRKAYEAAIVYGEIGAFQRDTLLDEFYNENMLGQRQNQNIIIDEVDSMLLDKGQNMLYLSHNIPGLDALETVYVNIWTMVHSKGLYGSKEDIQSVKHNMLSAIQGYTLPAEVLEHQLTSKQRDYLIRNGIIDKDGLVLIRDEVKRSATPYKLQCPESMFSSTEAGVVSCALQEAAQREPDIVVPNFLHPFVRRHLETWIQNAFIAREMREGEQYIIDIDRSESNRGKPSNVVIIDTETGTEQYNSQWHQGLHQFLQLKHGCRLSVESLKAVFMSNITFFKRYTPSIYGLTGTLGSEKERSLLQTLYDIDYVTIPTFRPSRFVEEETLVYHTEEDWRKGILKGARRKIAESRPVLVIFETIREVEKMEKICRQSNVEFQSYKRSYESIDMLTQSTCDTHNACIVLATNLAGRGTDIKITDLVNDLGGLHVILTYMPTNVRIEQQAFGRSARKGQNGTGQMIIMDTSSEMRTSEVMKIERDRNEEYRLSQIKHHFDTVIKTEEKLLQDFHKLYDTLRKAMQNRSTSVFGKLASILQGSTSSRKDMEKLILLSCLDEWAFALDSVQHIIKEGQDATTQINDNWPGKKRMKDGIQMLATSSTDMPVNIVTSPPRRIKLGLIMLSMKDYKAASNIFKHTVETEPHFADMAHYYTTVCLIHENCDDTAKFMFHLDEAERSIKRRIDEFATSVNIIDIVKDNFTQSRDTFLYSNDYRNQKEGLIGLYNEYLKSINSLRGYTIQAAKLRDEVTEDPVMAALLLEDLQSLGLVTKSCLDANALDKIQCLQRYYDEQSVKMIADKIKDKADVTAEDFLGVLPSIEELWKELKVSSFLEDETEYVLINKTEVQNSKVLTSMTKQRIFEQKSCQDLHQFATKSNNGWKRGRPVILHPEQLDELDKYVVLKQSDFESKFGPLSSWKYFIRTKVLKTNTTACIHDQAGITLRKFDRIDENSFTVCTAGNINISNSIFRQLQIAGILSYTHHAYLKTSDLDSVTLNGFEEYAYEVQKLLKHHCTYRIALMEFLADSKAISLPVQSNPHERLFDCMVYHKMVQPERVKTGLDADTISNKLKQLSIITKDDLAKIVSSRSVGNQNSYNHTTDVDSIFRIIKIYSSRNGVYRNSIDVTDLSPHQIDTLCLDLAMIPVTMILCYKFNSQSMTNKLSSALPEWMSTILRASSPMPNLVPFASLLDDDTKTSMSDELNILFDNGFDTIIQIGEARWTLKSTLRIAGVLAIGTAQIIAGATLEAFTAGTGTFVAGALISEGIGDIIFGFESAVSGNCSFDTYWQHKKMSLLMSTICLGVGVYCSWGAQFSRYANMIGGDLLPLNLTGSALVKEVGAKRLGREIAKRAGTKILQASRLGLQNIVVDKLVDSHIRPYLRRRMKYQVVTDLHQQLTGNFDANLNDLYRLVGRHEATRSFNKILKKVEENLDTVKKKKQLESRILDEAKRGVAIAEKKIERSKFDDTKAWVVKKLLQSLEVVMKSNDWLNSESEQDEMLKKINEGLDEEVHQQRIRYQNGHLVMWSGDGYDVFAAEMKEHLINFVAMRLENKITSTYVKPLAKTVISEATKFVRKEIQTRYSVYQKEKTKEQFEHMKKQYRHNVAKNKQKKRDGDQGDVSALDSDLELEYQKKLTELAKTCKDPDLYAAMIKEGIPLGVESLQALSEITRRRVIVHQPTNENSLSSTFKPSEDEEEEISEETDLIKFESHEEPIEITFTKDENGTSMFTTKSGLVFKCPLEAATHQLNNPIVTRDKIVQEIKSNSAIRDRIERGIHEHFMTKGLLGAQQIPRKADNWKDVEKMMANGNAVVYWRYFQYEERVVHLSHSNVRDDNGVGSTSGAKARKPDFIAQKAQAKKDKAYKDATYHQEVLDKAIEQLQQLSWPGYSTADKRRSSPPTFTFNYIEAAEHFRIDCKYLVSHNVRKDTVLALYQGRDLTEGVIKALATFCDSSLYEAHVQSQSYINHLAILGMPHERFIKGLTRECFKVYHVAKVLNGGKDHEDFVRLQLPTLDTNDSYKAKIRNMISRADTIEKLGKVIRTPAPCD